MAFAIAGNRVAIMIKTSVFINGLLKAIDPNGINCNWRAIAGSLCIGFDGGKVTNLGGKPRVRAFIFCIGALIFEREEGLL